MAQTTPPLNPPPLGANLMLQPGEEVLGEIRRHKIGLVYIYLEVLAGLVAMVALAAVLLPDFFRDLSGEASTMLTLGLILVVALVVVILALATNVYRQNKLIVTNRSIMQVLQKGPFAQKTSRLSMADVEDVTSDQKGLLQSIIGYGTLEIETSGELRNFIFTYTPDPSGKVELIGHARQRFVQETGNDS